MRGVGNLKGNVSEKVAVLEGWVIGKEMFLKR